MAMTRTWTEAYQMEVRFIEKSKEVDLIEKWLKDLWGAVLMRALADFFYLSPALSGHDRAWEQDLREMWREEAKAWILDDRIEINSFCGICELLGVDAVAIRSKVLQSEPRLKDLVRQLSDPPGGGQSWQSSRTRGHSDKIRKLSKKIQKMATYHNPAGPKGTEIARGGI